MQGSPQHNHSSLPQFRQPVGHHAEDFGPSPVRFRARPEDILVVAHTQGSVTQSAAGPRILGRHADRDQAAISPMLDQQRVRFRDPARIQIFPAITHTQNGRLLARLMTKFPEVFGVTRRQILVRMPDILTAQYTMIRTLRQVMQEF